jgi:4-amino-4-deoxy-L-arabinose transferase-like glycosyltransferase
MAKMHKRISKSRDAAKHSISIPEKQNTRRIITYAIIIILAAIPFAMGKYFELSFPDPYDSGAYVYSAQHILEGAEIGVEEAPTAKPGTLLVNMLGVWLLGFSQTGPKLMQMMFQIAALVLMFAAMRKLFGNLPAAIGVIIASVYLSAPTIAKFGNVKEQYMIAVAVSGISCLVLRQLGGRWWWAVLAGAFVSWGPLFKETGMSAIGAVGLFMIAQPLLKNRTWKQTGIDILLLLAGVVAAIGPLYVWILGWDVKMGLPYGFIWTTLAKILPAKSAAGTAGVAAPSSDYVLGGWQILKPDEKKEVVARVFRYYQTLMLPISFALASITARVIRLIMGWFKKPELNATTTYDRFVLLFAAWWMLDMAFVWISPRSYEQYYLPLNASAAMLGGYIVALYRDKVVRSGYYPGWILFGAACFIAMIAMSWHIFFGVDTSPHSGASYGHKSRGYLQKLDEIAAYRSGQRGAWEEIGEYIRTHSKPNDTIYVWGWYPGIYVTAQRFSSTPVAFTSEMYVMSPNELSALIAGQLKDFEKQPPVFIVDSLKRDYPWNKPLVTLWPITDDGKFLASDILRARVFDEQHIRELEKEFGETEALRYKAMQPFREYMMANYKIVNVVGGQQVLFELKTHVAPKQ